MVVLSILLGGYLTGASLYMLLFAIAAKFNTSKSVATSAPKEHSIAVFIPAYKEDAVIIPVAKEALKQSYTNYTVVVIADSLKRETLEQLSQLPIQLVEVNFEESTKVKALQMALNQLKTNYDIAVVLDADNVMEADFLSKINSAYSQGFKAIQGKRLAKNTDGSFALLDAISESINNNIYNLGQITLGFSARLVGSAMAFEYQLFASLIHDSTAIGGFDKELELKLLEKRTFIHYLDNAVVWDEKVSKGAVFAKQRTRWLSAQYFYLSTYGFRALVALLKEGNFDYFNKICQMALPPRLLLPVFLAIGALLSYYFGSASFGIWGLGLGANLLANIISIPRTFFSVKLIFAFLALPEAIARMFYSLIQLKKGNKKFYHTPHG